MRRRVSDTLSPAVMPESALPIDDGFLAVVKEDCPTCKLVVPALEALKAAGQPLVVVTQDDPAFPDGPAALYPTGLRSLDDRW